jgi:hypothetical protein
MLVTPPTALMALATLMSMAAGGVARAQAQQSNAASPPDPITVAPSFTAERFIAASTPVSLSLSRVPSPEEGALVVMLGTTDVTALFERRGTRLIYQSRTLPLASGEHDVVVYLATRSTWSEVARLPIKVLTPHGFSRSSIAPTATMNNKGRLAQSDNVEPAPGSRAAFEDFQFATGLHSTQERGPWQFDGQANALGVTNRREALRFNEDSTHAPRYDLANYTLSLRRGASSLSIGDVSVGSNRYLANGFAARGVAATIGTPALSLSLGALGGSPDVGWEHPLGFTRPQHHVATATLNAELRPSQPGMLHLDVTLVNGSLLPRSGFTRGALTDAEKSDGAGVQLTAALPSQRARVSGGIAESRFANPHDPLLAGDLTTTTVAPVRRTARFVEANVVLVRDYHLAALPAATIEAGLRHEHVDPLYRSVAAGTQADVLANGATLNTTLGALSVQSSVSRSNDNLAGVPSLMRTFTRVANSQSTLPLAALFRRSAPGSAWPTLSYAFGRTHQSALTMSDDSPFQPGDLPNLVATTHDAGVQWQASAWRFGYRFNASVQDNRQFGRGDADQLARTHTVSVGRTISQRLELGLDASDERHTTRDVGQHTRLERVGGTINWRPTSFTSLTANATSTTSADQPRTQRGQNMDVNAELSQGLPFGRAADQSPRAQAFLRYARQSFITRAFTDPLAVATRESNGTWTLASGLTLRLF